MFTIQIQECGAWYDYTRRGTLAGAMAEYSWLLRKGEVARVVNEKGNPVHPRR